MYNLLIVGARGFGREVYNLATECEGYNKAFSVKGFLDDKITALDGFDGYPPIIDSVENYVCQEDDRFVVALGDVRYRKKYAEILISRGATFFNLIHPTAYIGRNTTIGMGCILCAFARLSCDIKVGDFVSFQSFTDIGHDAVIGDYCALGAKSFMGGGSILESLVTVHTGANVSPHIRISLGATVGSNSVVVTKVPKDKTVFGIPAKKLEF